MAAALLLKLRIALKTCTVGKSARPGGTSRPREHEVGSSHSPPLHLRLAHVALRVHEVHVPMPALDAVARDDLLSRASRPFHAGGTDVTLSGHEEHPDVGAVDAVLKHDSSGQHDLSPLATTSPALDEIAIGRELIPDLFSWIVPGCTDGARIVER